MLPDSVDAEGRLNVTTDLPDASSTIVGGVAVNAEGQIHITNVISDLFANGLMVTDLGQLCFSAAPIDGPYLHGFPRKADGRLVGQADTTPDPKDPFVAGIRVGALGGIYSTYVAPPVGDAPVNTTPPDVTGDAIVGSTLTCSTGTWTGTEPITYTYRWYQGATPIIGATNSTYVAQAGDLGSVLVCAVTATNALGAASEPSNGIRMVNARYNYKNNAGVPTSGVISAGSAGAPLQVRIHDTDLDGVNHSGPFSRMEAGDSIFINGQEGYLTEAPIDAGSYYICEMLEWPALPDGEYLVQLGYANENTLADEVRQILAKYGADAHMYLPGIGVVDGFEAGNYLGDAGTIAATVDNPVGLVLDAAGSVLPNEIATPFDNTYTNNTGVVTSGGTLTATAAAAGYLSFKDGAVLTAGKTYKVSFNHSVSAFVQPFVGGAGGTSANGTGVSTQYIVAGATSRIQFNASGTVTGTISNLSVKEVTGIHATQATTANKPILRSDSGLYSWQFDGSNDSLALGSVPFQPTDDHCIVLGFKKESASWQCFYGQAAGGAGEALPYIGVTNGNAPIFNMSGGGTSINIEGSASQVSLGTDYVLSGRVASSLASARLNGVSFGAPALLSGTYTTATNAYIGALGRSSLGTYMAGSLYPLILIKGAVTDEELLTLEQYVALRSGVVL